MSDREKLHQSVQKVGQSLFQALPDSESTTFADTLERIGLGSVQNPREVTCNLCSFDLLLKSALYESYTEEYSDLSPLPKTDSIIQSLQKASEITGDRAIEPWRLDAPVEYAPDSVLAPIFDSKQYLITSGAPTKRIGNLFESLITQEARRVQGQFYTSETVSELMAKWSVQRADDTVIDPGIGTGVLAASVYRAKQRIGDSASVDDIHGVDLNRLAVTMSKTGLRLENSNKSINIKHSDFMDTYVNGGNQRLDQKNPVTLPEADAVVSNPPYSRSGALDDDRSRFNRIVDGTVGMSVSEHSPLYVYFFAHAAHFLRDGGRMAFLTPARFCDTNYGVKLREFLLTNFHIHAIIFLESGINAFEGARVTPCVTLLERQEASSNSTTVLLQIKKEAEASEILDAINKPSSGGLAFGRSVELKQHNLELECDWRDYLSTDSVDLLPSLTSFDEIADIKRGIATGMNDYFCLTQSEVDSFQLDRENLAKIIRRTDGSEALRLDENDWEQRRDNGEAVWLLYCYTNGNLINPDNNTESLQSYFNYGKKIGANDTYLANSRKYWYAVDKREVPDVLVTYMSKSGFRFIENKAGVRTLNNLHNVYLSNYNNKEVRALLAYLNSSVASRVTQHSSRTYAEGLNKIEPGELKEIPVIDPKKLTNKQVNKLAIAFDRLCDSLGGAGDTESQQARLDDAVEETLSDLAMLTK